MNILSSEKSQNRAAAVPPGTSLYLDVVRFSAAMVVLLGHASGRLLTGGFLWQLGGYLQTAVIVFFVLSGFVISSVLIHREKDPVTYARQRVARIYSVVIPALVLTAVCDAIGLSFNPDLYYNGPWSYPVDNQVLRYLLTFFLLNQTWIFPDMAPGINTPFWSLSFEAFYYVFVGLIFFSSGILRIISIIFLSMIAGPTILSLFPIWMLGFFVYRFGHGRTISQSRGVVVAGIGLVLLLISPFIRAMLPNYFGYDLLHRDGLMGDYVDAIAFSLHLYGVMCCDGWFERKLRGMSGTIRWFGSLTFALYLFHRPLIQLFAALPLAEPTAWLQRLYLLGGTFLVVATLGRRCELWKFSISAGLSALRYRLAVGRP